jgi:hypothetical protein
LFVIPVVQIFKLFVTPRTLVARPVRKIDFHLAERTLNFFGALALLVCASLHHAVFKLGFKKVAPNCQKRSPNDANKEPIVRGPASRAARKIEPRRFCIAPRRSRINAANVG